MDSLLNTIVMAQHRCRSKGPHRTVVNSKGHCCTSRRALHDFVLVRDDGHTLGVPIPWLVKARNLYEDRWVAMLKHDRTLSGYHRVW
jgi:hypothetical protein